MVEEVEAAEALLVLGRRRKEQNYELGELKPLAERMVGHSFHHFLIDSCQRSKCFGLSRIDVSKSKKIPHKFHWVELTSGEERGCRVLNKIKRNKRTK